VSKVPSYELIYIVRPEVTEEELPNVLNTMSDTIIKFGGKVVEVTQWGKKRLTFPIKKCIEGNYILTRMELASESAKELESTFRFPEEILRHLLVRAGD
jgi:small subunit ribosomal protein S6